MISKKSFKVLEEIADKGSKKLNRETNFAPRWQKDDFIHIPGIAYRTLYYGGRGYEYIKDGLYIQKERMNLTENLWIICSEITETDLLENWTKKVNLTWKESKQLSQKLNGELLSLAELMYTIKYLEDRDIDSEFRQDLMFTNCEWLDGYINNKKLYVGSRVVENGVYDGVPSPIKYTKNNKWFSFEDIDEISGLPNELQDVGKFFYTDSGFAKQTMYRSWVGRTQMDGTNTKHMQIYTNGSGVDVKMPLRLAFTPEQLEGVLE